MTKLIGYTGRGAQKRARDRSLVATTKPRVVTLRDGSYVGAGDEIIKGDGTRDVRLYGAHDTSCWHSEAREAGLVFSYAEL